MIKLCVFDMGGVLVRDHQMGKELYPFLGITESGFAGIDVSLSDALRRHSTGNLSEGEFWALYKKLSGKDIPFHEGSLFGKFFHPKLDEPTVQVVTELKAHGMRVVAGTNVIDSHYKIHQKLNQYDVFALVYASHLIGIAKPDTTFYEHILKAENLLASEVFFTDDSLENIEAASEIGIESFHYTDADTLREKFISLGLL